MMRTFILAAMLVAGSIAPAAALQNTEAPGTYNYYNMAGNLAAAHADFVSAIRSWKRAAALDRGPDVACRGAIQRADIATATEMLAKMRHGLSKANAAQAYQQRLMERWMHDPCNKP